MYTRIFQNFSCRVSSTRDPKSAIGMVESYKKAGYPFGIACINYSLEGLNGISLAKKIKLIDPQILLKLFPTRLLGNSRIKEEYETFGGFFGWPDITSWGVLKVINQAKINRKEGQSSG